MTKKLAPFNTAHPIIQILLFLFLMLIIASFSTFLGTYVAAFIFNINISGAEEISKVMANADALILIQIISATGTFILPAIIFAKLFKNEPSQFFKTTTRPSLQIVIYTIVLFLLANFVLGLLVNVMELIPFESYDNDIIKYLLNAEVENQHTIEKFLDFKSPFKLIPIFLMMAIIPGIGEELTFRGVFMNLFNKSTNNILFAIICSSFIFALIHLQLHNFLAIFFMGALLGTIYHLTQNLWVSVLAHFFNNGMIVFATYLNNIGIINFDFAEKTDMPLNYSIFGSLIFFIAFYFYRNFIIKTTNPQ